MKHLSHEELQRKADRIVMVAKLNPDDPANKLIIEVDDHCKKTLQAIKELKESSIKSINEMAEELKTDFQTRLNEVNELCEKATTGIEEINQTLTQFN